MKKTIFLGFWANKSVTNENGIVVERYDIPLDGWMVTAKIYGVDTNGEVIDEILDSLNFNMNLKTHFSTERFNITHWPEFDSNGNFKDFIELDFKDILKNFEQFELDDDKTIRFESKNDEKVEDVIMTNP